MTVAQVAFSSFPIWFFDKAFCLACFVAIAVGYWVAVADISVPCLWCCWLNTDSDKLALCGQVIGQLKCLAQRVNVGNNGISTERGHNGFRVLVGNGCCSPGNGRSRTTSTGFAE